MTQNQSNEESAPVLAQIELPKGGGAISSIGEKFSVNTVTGAGTASVPIPVSPGRNGFQPQLSLTYNSGAGNSPFGLGWGLGLGSISRKTAKGIPEYKDSEESDVFVINGAEDLVPVLEKVNGAWARKVDSLSEPDFTIYDYRPRIENNFSLIQKWVHKNDSSTVQWRVISRDNAETIYGATRESQIYHPEKGIFTWLIAEQKDNRGNIIRFHYKSEDAVNINQESPAEESRMKADYQFTQKYIKKIEYGNHVPDRAANWHFQLLFDYGEHDFESPTVDAVNNWHCRKDPFSSYKSGFEIRTYRLCRQILMFHQFEDLNEGELTLVRSTNLKYDHNEIASTLIQSWQSGYIKNESGYSIKSTPNLKFTYSAPIIGKTIHELPKTTFDSTVNDPAIYQFLDLESEGLMGILTENDGSWHYKSNQGNGHFASSKLLQNKPTLTGQGRPQIVDIDGDGNKELLVRNNRVEGFYNYEDEHWNNFKTFQKSPKIDWQNPNLRLVDLTGDGYADLLIAEDDTLRWFPSFGKKGYGNSRNFRNTKDNRPTALFSNKSERLFLADLSGDGMTDLLRIRNGEVVYWPNMGYGEFGSKITMENAPVFTNSDLFREANIRLADVDGTGTTDLIYLDNSGARIWLNQSGNGFSEVKQVETFPGIDSTTRVQVIDLLGTGTPCLVWASALPNHQNAPLKYINLMESTAEKPLGKPYLLNAVDNGMGKINRFHYAPSTQFYLADKAAEKPWITKLHFPVYVVEKVEVLEQLTNTRLVSSYRYHHGFFDPVEREFRGFGMVEQVDAESFNTYSDDEHFIPPILTKTWFHTGAYLKKEIISKQHQSEYFSEGQQGVDFRLEDSYFAGDLNEVDELPEVYRALRGSQLRQEVYSLDGSEKEGVPYTVTEANFSIRQLQPKQRSKFGVFQVLPSESIVFNYERDCCDPRVVHNFTLEVDPFGHPLRTAEVVYPRRPNHAIDLPDEQLKLHILLSENRFTNHVNQSDFYVLGVPVDGKSYEVKGINLPNGQLYFTKEFLKYQLDGIEAIPFYPNLENNDKTKRLIQWEQHLYWNNSQTEKLPFGEITWPLLPHHSEQAVFTADLLEAAFENSLTETEINEKGGYIFREGYWWNPGVITHFHYHDIPNNDDRNRANPFLFPVEVQDPFELAADAPKRARVFFDAANLMVTSADDAEGFTTYAAIDYRTLSPVKMVDVNENTTEVLTDELGMVIATTQYGTELNENGEVVLNGDLALETYEKHEALSVTQVLDDPTHFLQGASTFFWYDLKAWESRQQPVQFLNLTRETHARNLDNPSDTEIQISIGFSDGFGRELQEKVRVEDGIAHLTDESRNLKLDQSGQPVKGEVNTRWLSSGRTIFNNKEKPIKQYEPFYIDSPHYLAEELVPKIGVSATIYYDPLLRAIKTVSPKGFFSKIEFSSWEAATYDFNDTVRDSDYYQQVVNQQISVSDEEREALLSAEFHYNTPSRAIFDSLGRPFKSIETDQNGTEFMTVTTFNITGQPLKMVDARQFELNKNRPENEQVYNYRHLYDMAGTPLKTESIDAGNSAAFINVLGNPVCSWAPRGFKSSIEYDRLQRPIQIQTEGGHFSAKICVEKMVYANPETTLPESNNRGQVIAHYDQTGKMETARTGFKGNALETNKRFLSVVDANGQLNPNLNETIDWNETSDADLENEVFTVSGNFNALGQVITSTSPDGSIHRPTFNRSGLLKKVEVRLNGAIDFQEYVKNITYNEKAQRESIQYGNGTRAHYHYDSKTYALRQLKTIRSTDQKVLQDLHYWYDPIENIIQIKDKAQQTVYFDNQVVEPINSYTYDAFYQLKTATGREHISQNDFRPVMDQVQEVQQITAHKADGTKMQNYVRSFTYDEVGNMLSSKHNPNGGQQFERKFQYAANSNHLLKSGIGQESNWQNYTYDAAGNTQKLGHLDVMLWNYKNELQSLKRSDLMAVYQYDSHGERARKIIKKGKKKVEVRYYLGSVEIYREYKIGNSTVQHQRNSLHIMDDTRRICLVDMQTVKDGKPINRKGQDILNRYQYSNHLGSASLELDGTAKIISYEEYYPNGSTSFEAVDKTREVQRKRYRYTGMERDEESGLNYHSARYYAPWLCRWLKPDPAGTVDGLNVWRYVRGNPVKLVDPSGNAPPDPKALNISRQQVYKKDRRKQSRQYNNKQVGKARTTFPKTSTPRALPKPIFNISFQINTGAFGIPKPPMGKGGVRIPAGAGRTGGKTFMAGGGIIVVGELIGLVNSFAQASDLESDNESRASIFFDHYLAPRFDFSNKDLGSHATFGFIPIVFKIETKAASTSYSTGMWRSKKVENERGGYEYIKTNLNVIDLQETETVVIDVRSSLWVFGDEADEKIIKMLEYTYLNSIHQESEFKERHYKNYVSAIKSLVNEVNQINETKSLITKYNNGTLSIFEFGRFYQLYQEIPDDLRGQNVNGIQIPDV